MIFLFIIYDFFIYYILFFYFTGIYLPCKVCRAQVCVVIIKLFCTILLVICLLQPYLSCPECHERWGAGVETQKNVRGEIGGWGRVPFNETYALMKPVAISLMSGVSCPFVCVCVREKECVCVRMCAYLCV